LPRDLITFEDTVNDIGIHSIFLTFGSDKPPRFDNYTVVISGTIEADYSDGQ
jgi:hypothetical protein